MAHKTRRGELMAKLEGKKISAGHYAIRGFEAKMIREASGSRPGLWTVADADGDHSFDAPHLTEVLEQINTWTSTPLEVEVEVETVPTEVEIVDEIPEPVAAAVDAEPVTETVVEVPKSTKPRTRPYKTRRSELLATLGAREVGTAEYEVAGHQVMYVAPGVMPRGAGGRWRTTLLTADGVVVSWNLSLTDALEVVALRVDAVSNVQVTGRVEPTANTEITQFVDA